MIGNWAIAIDGVVFSASPRNLHVERSHVDRNLLRSVSSSSARDLAQADIGHAWPAAFLALSFTFGFHQMSIRRCQTQREP